MEYNTYTERISYSEQGMQEMGLHGSGVIKFKYSSIIRVLSDIKDFRKELYKSIDIIDDATGVILATFSSSKGLNYTDSNFYKMIFLEFYDNLD